MTKGKPPTHSDLVKKAAAWLRRQGCHTVLTELVCDSFTNEIPDAIGWKREGSVLVEVKTSRSDFLADSKKRFRSRPEWGMGDLRYYLCPEGVIKKEDLPDKWGLLWMQGQRAERVVSATLQRGYLRTERSLLLSALRRKKS